MLSFEQNNVVLSQQRKNSYRIADENSTSNTLCEKKEQLRGMTKKIMSQVEASQENSENSTSSQLAQEKFNKMKGFLNKFGDDSAPGEGSAVVTRSQTPENGDPPRPDSKHPVRPVAGRYRSRHSDHSKGGCTRVDCVLYLVMAILLVGAAYLGMRKYCPGTISKIKKEVVAQRVIDPPITKGREAATKDETSDETVQPEASSGTFPPFAKTAGLCTLAAATAAGGYYAYDKYKSGKKKNAGLFNRSIGGGDAEALDVVTPLTVTAGLGIGAGMWYFWTPIKSAVESAVKTVKRFFGFKTKDPPKVKIVEPEATEKAAQHDFLPKIMTVRIPVRFDINLPEDPTPTEDLPLTRPDPVSDEDFKESFEKKWGGGDARPKTEEVKDNYNTAHKDEAKVKTKHFTKVVNERSATLFKPFKCPLCENKPTIRSQSHGQCKTCCVNFKFKAAARYLKLIDPTEWEDRGRLPDHVPGAVEYPPSHFCSKCKGEKCICCKDGTAKGEESLKCERCDGTGQKYVTNCRECLGSGVKQSWLSTHAKTAKEGVPVKPAVICVKCKGKGKTHKKGYDTKCSKCKGKKKLYVVRCRKCDENDTNFKAHKKDKNKEKCVGFMLISTCCTSCSGTCIKGQFQPTEGKCATCLGTGRNFHAHNPYLPIFMVCAKNVGTLWKTPCYKCIDSKAGDCKKCYSTGIKYRRLTKEAARYLKNNPNINILHKLCDKCHGKGNCKTCGQTGLKRGVSTD